MAFLSSVRGLSKDYATRVLDAVDLEIAPGEVHSLIGANGAGKSTLCRILAGLTEPSAGEMTLDGAPYAPDGKRSAEEAGVQIVRQELDSIGTLSVAENLFFNRLPHRGGWIRRKVLRRGARRALARVGLEDLDPDLPMATLGVGTQQLVEIAGALEGDCLLLILDEPTAALSEVETERLFTRIDQLRESGISILYVSHRLEEIRRISDRVTVLRDGRRTTTRDATGFGVSEMVSEMTGQEADRSHPFTSHRRSELALRVEKLELPPMLRGIDVEVRRGERLGIAGLVGSGRTELLRALFGADRAHSGGLRLGSDPQLHRFTRPSQAVQRGLAMVTEDRKRNGLLLPLSVTVNGSLARLPRRAGMVDHRGERARIARRREELAIHCHSLEQPVDELSGGNQQKVVLAKWLERDAEVLLLDEPTRGVDVAARGKIYRLLDRLASQGKALVVVSSDLDELMEHCDAIAVMAEGRLVARFERQSWSRREIMAAAFPLSGASTQGTPP